MFSRLYGAIVGARNALYERGVFKFVSLGAKVISVGNITVGGTGKTPLVALVAEILSENGEKVCVLTRGYGRENPKRQVLVSDGEKILADAKAAGDEPIELAGKLLGKAIVVANANRAEAGIWARERFGATAFVLDDAFQHRRVRRDADIVCIDATNPFGNEKLLPSGILREPLANLQRADAIVITRANLVGDAANLKAQIRNFNARCPIFTAKNKISKLIKLSDFHGQNKNLEQNADFKLIQTEHKFLAFCALGNPNNFFAQLRAENFNLVGARAFSDHHFYTPKDIEKLSAQAQEIGAEKLVTTAKDAVKIKNLSFGMPCFVAESEIIFDVNADFSNWILSV